jgi:hypothetical protein
VKTLAEILEGVVLTGGGNEAQGVSREAENASLLGRLIFLPPLADDLLGVPENGENLHGCETTS